MDLVQRDEEKQKLFEDISGELKELATGMDLTAFATSIWDETLYKAWSSIVYSLVPNVDKLESQLHKFCKLCQADEIVLFEKSYVFGN